MHERQASCGQTQASVASARTRGICGSSRQRQHYILKHPNKPNLRITLPWHNQDLKRGTLASSIDQAGFTISEFMEWL
ncbi:MAG: type II toxin-antitoxin system HicA family toxin [Bryobacteraceae bacterium]